MSQIDPPADLLFDPGVEAEVVVVVVTYNSAAVIGALLAALPAALRRVPRCRVVITDNDSTDGTPRLIREMAPWVTLVDAGRNAGYAGGINIALSKHIGTRGVYILNPDAVPSPGSIATLLEALEGDPRIGIATPRILGAGGAVESSLRREPTLMRAIGEAFLGGTRTSRWPWLGETIDDPGFYRDGAIADWATGAAMFLSRAVIEAVGEWDERFFLYSEETDYALRARDAGYRLQLVHDAIAVHQGGEQSTSPYLWAISAVNRTRLYRKRHSLPPSCLYWAAVLTNEAIRAVCGRKRSRAALRALLLAGPNPPGTASTPEIIAAWARQP